MRKFILILFTTLFFLGSVYARKVDLLPMNNKDMKVVLFPTAYTLQKAQYDLNIEMTPFKIATAIGLTNRLAIGVSYGGNNVIGTESISWNPRVEFTLKYRLWDERYNFPAISVGFSSVGWGNYFGDDSDEPDYKRYLIKSRGFFAVMSKSTSFLGGTLVNLGMNYSVEGDEEEKSRGFDLFVGLEKNINEELILMGEYDFALNDNGKDCIGDGKGYFNLGLRWIFAPELTIDIQVINIFANFNTDPTDGDSVPEKYNKIARNISISYKTFF